MSLRLARIVLIMLTLAVTIPANAQLQTLKNPPTSRKEFCELTKSSANILKLADNPDNYLAFANSGGLFNGGVCWWHSLFQRASLYLALFRPELQKPTTEQAKKIIHSLASGKRVVEIPGYRNMREFSYDWETIIQAKLEEWQLVDGFLKFAWIRGLSGSPSIAPLKLERKITSYLDLVTETSDVQWLMLQMDGITSHSALLLSGENQNPLYSLTTIDSNYVGHTKEFIYRSGDSSIFDPVYYRFVPYLGRRSDIKRFKEAIARYCSSKPHAEAAVEEDLNNGFE